MTTHGKTNSSEYKAWNNMVNRSTNPNHPRYKDWGGRGITVCDKWKTFTGFYDDMGDKPSPKHTLERRDNTKGYTKENCYWATTREQAINRRSNKVLAANGYRFTMIEWSEKLSINKITLASRLRRGWTVLEVLEGKRHAK